MGTVRLGVFPSLNNKEMQDSIANSVAKWYLKHFPFNFFKNIYIDTQINNQSNYIINDSGEFVKVETGKKLQLPNIKFSFKQGGNNTSDVFGTDIWNVNQQPGAFSIDADLTGYRPILYDPYGSIIALNERTIRNQFEITIKVNSKADQLAICNYLDSNIKMNYVQVIKCNTVLPIHRLMLTYLRSCIFKPEIDILNKMEEDSEEKIQFQRNINRKFMELLYKCSEEHIKPYKSLEESKENNNYLYGYNQTQRITIRLDKYDADDGNRRGGAWDLFTINLNGFIEYGNPISFITSVNAIIRGTKNDWRYNLSADRDMNNYYNLIEFKEVYKENRHLLSYNSDKYAHFYLEKEILMTSKTENFNILGDLITLEDSPNQYYIFKSLLSLIKDQEEFDNMFLINVYKNNDPIDKSQYKIDKNGNFLIRNCDLNVPYYIDIFINKVLYDIKLEYMKNKLKNIKNIDKKVEKLIEKGPVKDIPGELIVKDYGIGYIPTEYYDNENQFIPIKPIDFLMVDDKYDYYIREDYDTGEYRKVDNEKILSDKDIVLYMKNGDEYVKIDRNNVIIPDKHYKFFIYDRNSDKFILERNLRKFDILQQYYILKTQYKYGRIEVGEM